MGSDYGDHRINPKNQLNHVSSTTGTGGGIGVTVGVVVTTGVSGVGGGMGTYVVAGGNGFDRMLALFTAAGTLWK